MRQKLCKRLEELERISAAAGAQEARTSSIDRPKMDALWAKVEAWRADPERQKWLAEQPPDYLHHRVQSLRAQLAEIAYGHSRSAHPGGLR